MDNRLSQTYERLAVQGKASNHGFSKFLLYKKNDKKIVHKKNLYALKKNLFKLFDY